MENQTELKWYQKPTGVIILLILFFPVGLYLMWKNELWTKQTRWIVTGVIALLILANAGKNKSGESSSSSTESTSENQTEISIDGTYSYDGGFGRTEIRIKGNSWTGKTMMVTGFGSAYDNQNAKYFNGIVKGNDLYERSGNVIVGYVSGDNLTTSIGGQTVTLYKD